MCEDVDSRPHTAGNQPRDIAQRKGCEMRVNFFSVPVLALASSMTMACSGGDDAAKAISMLETGGFAGVGVPGAGGGTSTGSTDVGTTPPTTTSTGGTTGVG